MMVRDGQLVTPGVTESILESITRASIIELARDLGVEVVERAIDRTELYIADEVFFCGTAAEITVIGSVDRYVVGNGDRGPIEIETRGRNGDTMRCLVRLSPLVPDGASARGVIVFLEPTRE